jgi:ferredoxin
VFVSFFTQNSFLFIQLIREGIIMFTIKITDPNAQWIGSDTESVLDGAQRNGVKIPYACKGGGCGLCKVRVEEGEFERGRSSIAVLPNDERILNYTLACKTYPKGNMKIQLDMSRTKEYMEN